jgi:hypothetical protein
MTAANIGSVTFYTLCVTWMDSQTFVSGMKT